MLLFPLSWYTYLLQQLFFFLQSFCLMFIGPELHPEIVFRIIEVLHSAYKVGHIPIADYISFCATLLSCSKVSQGITPNILSYFSRNLLNTDWLQQLIPCLITILVFCSVFENLVTLVTVFVCMQPVFLIWRSFKCFFFWQEMKMLKLKAIRSRITRL